MTTSISIEDLTLYVQTVHRLLAAINAANVQRDPRHRVSMLVNNWDSILDAAVMVEGRAS